MCFLTLFLLRSEYFKTALDTAVGEKKKFIEVTECNHNVLATIIDYIYGTEIPDDLNLNDLKCLLGMADLYIMEDLKVAVSSSIGKRLTSLNLLEMLQLGEKYTAQKLKEVCTDFLISNENRGSLANKILGADLDTPFKKRIDFKSDEEYRVYLMATLKPNMIVKTLRASPLAGPFHEESFGRVVSCNPDPVVIMWQTGKDTYLTQSNDLEILTPPINMNMFSN